MKHLALKTKALRNCAAWPAELFPVVSRAGRLTEQFFILVLNSPQAAVVSATERLSYGEAKLSPKGRTERWIQEMHSKDKVRATGA